MLRLRRAGDDERRQLLWIASSAVFLAIGVVVILAVPRLQGEEGTWVAALPLRLAQLAVPLCVAVAVLRHRLLEIDLIVNRALMVSLATGLAAIGYVTVVVVVGSAVGEGGGGFWPSLIATALVALAFQPLRRRVVRLADRLAFGAAAAPYEALADFSRRLGDEPDPAALLPAVAEAAAQAVNATRAVVSVHVPGGPHQVAAWPTDAKRARSDVPGRDSGRRPWRTAGQTSPWRWRPDIRCVLETNGCSPTLRTRPPWRSATRSSASSSLPRSSSSACRHSQLDQSRARLISAGDAERSRVERAIARQ